MKKETNIQPGVLKPSPLTLGGVVRGAFTTVFRKRFGQFAILALIPGLVLLIANILPLPTADFSSIQDGVFNRLEMIGTAVLFVVFSIGYLVQIKIQAMIVLGTHDVIQQRPSTVRDLHQRTIGVTWRVLLVLLLMGSAALVTLALIFGIPLAISHGTARVFGNGDFSWVIGSSFAGELAQVLLTIAAGIFAYYLSVRFIYLVPALAIEGLGALDSLKRSWRLTKANFWGTLGYYLVGSLLVSLAGTLLSPLADLVPIPALSTSAIVFTDPTAAMLALIPARIIVDLPSFATQVLALPFMIAYITVMYVDRIRRDELATAHRAGNYPSVRPTPYPQGLPPTGSAAL